MKRIFSIVTVAIALACAAITPAHAASLVYDNYLQAVFAGNASTSATYKCALVSNSYTANKGTHVYWSDVTGEVTGTGYTAGGNTVVPTFTLDTTNHRMTIVIPQTTWTSSTITAYAAVCYISTGTSSTSRLVLYDDFGGAISSSTGTFTLNASTIHFNIP
jgi:hypothetical protein